MNPEDDDDDRTVIRPRSARTEGPPPLATSLPAAPPPADAPTLVQAAPKTIPPTTGTPTMTVQASHAITLPAGTRLGEFEVTSTIGEGGFGIVYLAWDHSLDRKVALKEYMPSSIAFRAGETEIRVRSERHQETFDAGMKSFINEAKLLAQFDHPSLLKVYRFWEANHTAYMVMPFLEGATVRDTVRAMPSPPDEAWIVGLLQPVCDALAMLHAVQVYHRDIAPDNILLLAETGRPLLLDFGAARRVIGDMTQALTAILKPGYAPVEQYADMPGLKQGPWTDVYALAAVAHWMILGKTPSPSVGRLFDDAYVPLAKSAAGRYSDHFLQAIDRGLAVMPDKRTPTVEAFRADLVGASAPTSSAATTAVSPRTMASPPSQAGHDETTRRLPSKPTATVPATSTEPAVASSGRAVSPSSSRKPLLIGAGVVVVIAIAVGAWLGSRSAPSPSATTVTPASATTTPASTDAASAVATPTTTPPSTTITPPVATESTPPSATSPAPAPAPATIDAAAPTATTTPNAVATPTPSTPYPTPATTSSTTSSTAPPKTARARPEPKPETRDRRAETPPRTAEPRTAETRSAEPPAPAGSRDECARLFQRLSIGDTDQALIDRIRTLRCR